MTSHKLCRTFLVVVCISAIVTGSSIRDSAYESHRVRRSSDGKQSAESASSNDDAEDDVGVFHGGYRFGDEFFLPEASKSIPAEYKKKADGCERLVKNTMVCMVCKDPKTNAKYEQCSYVGNPPPKKAPAAARHPAATTTSSYAAADESSAESVDETSAPPSRGSSANYESSSPGDFSPRESSTPSRRDYESSSPGDDYSTRESSTPSRGDYDSSSPGDYSARESSSTPSRGDYSTFESTKPSGAYSYKDDYAPAPYSLSASSGDESASSSSSEDPAESSLCRQIERGAESCKICKDPKTGKDFERCSSSFRPDDKSYAYGKTERYGYPESGEEETEKDDARAELRTFENDDEAKSAETSEDPAETSECRQVKKDDQTCTICKDPKTGGDSERCSSSYRPADESYAYGTSEKFGGPSARGKDDDKSYGDDESDKSADATYDIPSEYRYPKSNDETYKNYHTDLPDYSRSPYDGSSSGYDSSDAAEYAAPSVPAAATKPSSAKAADGCHEVRKDSMTCTVCADPKTGGNFEKCSYAYQPDDKVYKFTKSKTFGYPDAGKTGGESGKSYGDSDGQSESKQVEAVKASPCKQIQRDSMICTVCKDPKTGVSSEQCAYGSLPSDKLFGNGAGKNVGNPSKEREAERASRQFVAESKQIAEKIKTNPCRKIEKDSMTCTVCKDPKTGASSEQCSYSSKPKENRYTYSKSKSSGNPKKAREGEEGEGEDGERLEPRETKETAESVEAASPACRKIEKESMTCTVCKDPKTGENSEQCAYSYKPKERHFTYTKSKSFGNPRKDGEGGSQEEKPEETHQISQWSNDDYYAKVHRPRGFSKPQWTYGE